MKFSFGNSLTSMARNLSLGLYRLGDENIADPGISKVSFPWKTYTPVFSSPMTITSPVITYAVYREEGKLLRIFIGASMTLAAPADAYIELTVPSGFSYPKEYGRVPCADCCHYNAAYINCWGHLRPAVNPVVLRIWRYDSAAFALGAGVVFNISAQIPVR